MGLFDKLLGKPDYSESMLQAGFALAAEIDRVYRNQLENIPPVGCGLYQARLLSAAFVFAAYKLAGCAKNKKDLFWFLNACSGIALEPFNQPGANPSFSKESAAALTVDFMNTVFELIKSELSDGPSTLTQKTAAFGQLVDVYHVCLAESIGMQRYMAQKAERALEAESIIWTHLRFLGDILNQIVK